MKKIIASASAAVLLGGAGIAVAGPATAAKKYTACVKKSTGETRLLLGKSKKCTKGWKKVTWLKAGPKGAKGPDGATGEASTLGFVVDAQGTVVGKALGILPVQGGIISVQIDGARYTYFVSGLLLPTYPPVYFDNASCSGALFTTAADVLERDLLTQDPAVRLVDRPASPTEVGPARAYRPDGSSSAVVNQPRWYLNSSSVCTADSNFTGYRVPVVQTTAPRDFVGPLRFV